MANKPDKFGLKFLMAVDVKTKYLFNGVPYLGKNDFRLDDVSVPTRVVIKLMNRHYLKKAITLLVTSILRHWIFRCALRTKDAVIWNDSSESKESARRFENNRATA